MVMIMMIVGGGGGVGMLIRTIKEGLMKRGLVDIIHGASSIN